MESNLKKIEVHSIKEVITKDGKRFYAYKCVTKSGKLVDLKFTRLCNDLPVKPCFIYVKPENVNIQKNLKFPCVWVSGIHHIEDFPTKVEDDI